MSSLRNWIHFVLKEAVLHEPQAQLHYTSITQPWEQGDPSNGINPRGLYKYSWTADHRREWHPKLARKMITWTDPSTHLTPSKAFVARI